MEKANELFAEGEYASPSVIARPLGYKPGDVASVIHALRKKGQWDRPLPPGKPRGRKPRATMRKTAVRSEKTLTMESTSVQVGDVDRMRAVKAVCTILKSFPSSARLEVLEMSAQVFSIADDLP